MLEEVVLEVLVVLAGVLVVVLVVGPDISVVLVVVVPDDRIGHCGGPKFAPSSAGLVIGPPILWGMSDRVCLTVSYSERQQQIQQKGRKKVTPVAHNSGETLRQVVGSVARAIVPL